MTLDQILSEDWTEEKARKYLRDGFLVGLAAPLVTGSGAPLGINQEHVKQRLKVVRKILAEECMVVDDASEVMMLDVVMNALADRIEVNQVQAKDGDSEDMTRVMDLRYKADRRLLEAVDSLKKI